jgi:hypothetical protein
VTVKRREFIALLGAATVAWPLVARAQQSERMRRIGVLIQVGDNDTDAQARIKVLQETLKQLGWSNGLNIRFDIRWADGKMSSRENSLKSSSNLGQM